MSQRQYAYHCTNIDPEIIKREGWKVGNGFTIENMFGDLYEKYLPKVPVFVSDDGKDVWDGDAKYIIKLDITGLDLYPDFGSLSDTGAYYDPDEECFYWQDGFSNPEMEKYVSEYAYDDGVLYAADFSGADCMDVLGTACVDGNKLQGRIVSYTKKGDETMKINESTKVTLTLKQLKMLVKESNDEEPTPESVQKFIEQNKHAIAAGLNYLEGFRKMGLGAALKKIGFSLDVIPDEEWMEGKTDPTETSKEHRTIRIKQSYLDANPKFMQFEDECGWSFHEMTHAVIFSGNMPSKFIGIDSPFWYPMNTDEIYAFGFQLKHIMGTKMYDGLKSYYINKGGHDDFIELFDILYNTVLGTNVSESTKFTLTIGQLRRLIHEATINEAPDQEPLDRMEGDILRLGPCNHQKALCWSLQGFCFTPVKVNPSFSKRMPYMVLCNQDGIWQMHFENFGNFDSKPYLDALYKALAKTCDEQGIKEINAVGGCTPGGISGISALERYGFHKEYLPTPKTLKDGADGDKTNIYWGGATIDPAKAEKWLNGGKHLQEFLVVGNPEKRYKHPEECPLSEPTGEEKYTLDNTNPRPFMMVR